MKLKAELIIQVAPSNSIEKTAVAPMLLEIGVGDRIVRLIPQDADPSVWKEAYSFNPACTPSN